MNIQALCCDNLPVIPCQANSPILWSNPVLFTSSFRTRPYLCHQLPEEAFGPSKWQCWLLGQQEGLLRTYFGWEYVRELCHVLFQLLDVLAAPADCVIKVYILTGAEGVAFPKWLSRLSPALLICEMFNKFSDSISLQSTPRSSSTRPSGSDKK